MRNFRKIAACGCICLMVFSVTGSSCRIRARESLDAWDDSSWNTDSWDDESDDTSDDSWDDESDDTSDDSEDDDDAPAATTTPAPAQTVKSKKPSLNYTSLQLKQGAKKKLKTTNVKGKVTWSSSSKKVATVSKKGVVTAKKAGKATIRVKNSKGKKILSCKVTVYKKITPAAAKKKILSLKSKYKEGKTWTNGNYYFWKAINTHCYGCIAFAGKVSDTVFGKKASVKRHKKFANIKTGDHIRIGDYHSVIVLTHKGNKLTVVEGNYNSSIHWGRTITKAQLVSEGFYVETRY